MAAPPSPADKGGGLPPAFTDSEWAEISRELPTPADLSAYLSSRERLVAREAMQRSDAAFRASLSPVAERACEVVRRIRAAEKRDVWTNRIEERMAGTRAVTMHPGMMFGLAKETMEGTKLWRIVRRMPKGALLHAHLDAMVDFEYLVREVVMGAQGMCISAEGPLSDGPKRSEVSVLVRFRRKGGGGAGQAGEIWTDGYVAGTWEPLAEAADRFPDGGREGFIQWLKSRCMISQTDAVEQHHGVGEIWRKFRACFVVAASFLHYEPVWRAFVRRMLCLLVADGVSWAEIRFGWGLDYCREGEETPETDYNHMLQIFDDELARFRQTDKGKRFWGARLIWVAIRSCATRPIIQSMDYCIATKLAWPHLIAGFDLVGQEDLGRTLKDLLPEIFWFKKQCAEEGVVLPFFFHAGECLGSGDETDHNLFDAVALGTRRIGHGFSLYKHPLLTDLIKDRRILVESCPISNEVLRLCGSIMSHPLPAFLARGVPCSLSNDDPAILGQDTAGMTHDFWQACQGWEDLGLEGLGSLAENSVRWACFEDEDDKAWERGIKEASLGQGVKAERLKEWRKEWEEFCLWVVTEYGDEVGVN